MTFPKSASSLAITVETRGLGRASAIVVHKGTPDLEHLNRLLFVAKLLAR
jgi:hypothetical protein